MGLFDSVSNLIGPAAIGAGYVVGGPLGAGLAAGGLGYMGAQATNASNQKIAEANNAFSASQAANQMDYQTYMSNTSYQRAVKDLDLAGLNPMLAYMNGGASTPSGAMAVPTSIPNQNPMSAGVQSFSSASQAYKTDSDIQLNKAHAAKILEEIKNIGPQGDVLRFTVQKLAEDAALAAQKGETEVQIRKNMRETFKQIQMNTELIKLDVDAAKSLDNIGRTSKELRPIVDMIRSFFPSYHARVN